MSEHQWVCWVPLEHGAWPRDVWADTAEEAAEQYAIYSRGMEVRGENRRHVRVSCVRVLSESVATFDVSSTVAAIAKRTKAKP